MSSMRLTTLALFCVLTAVRVGSQPLDPEPELRYARVCDASGCYFAWNVVDSDRDGVSDADELLAGTDPYDPLSKPSLVVVVELAGASSLPSYEAGLGAFVVFPGKLQALLEESVKDPLSAFPLYTERKDALARAGISTELLAERGIDPTATGFTIGLARPDDSGLPQRKVGGIEIRLVSNEDDPAPLDPDCGKHGYLRTIENHIDGTIVMTYEDGAVRTEYRDHSGKMETKDGKPLGSWYVNPDADPAAEAPTPEEEKAWQRLHGAVIRTVEGWSAPEADDAAPRDPRTTIVLIDPQFAESPAMATDVPYLADAQPEARPDLPKPGQPASGGGEAGSCLYGCP